jgi:hypothetical protein
VSRCVNEASDTIAEVVDSLDAIRVSLNGSACRLERSRIGQFLTPIRIARFMASLFERRVEHARRVARAKQGLPVVTVKGSI